MESHTAGAEVYVFGPFQLDPARRVLLRDGHAVALSPKAFEILLLLVRNPEKLISKEQLMSELWPKVVVEESNLSQNVFVLRKALGDGEEGHRYIVTMPRRGYQFAEPVQIQRGGGGSFAGFFATPPPPGTDARVSTPPTSRTLRPLLIAGILIAGVTTVAAGLILLSSRFLPHPTTLAATDTTHYVLTLQASNCTNGDIFGRAQARASDKNHVLDALGSIATSLRGKLGGSLNSVQKFDVSPEAVTTPSLEALQAYSLASRTMTRRNDYPAAIPLFQHAIALDPNFAMAYALLGINLANIGEYGRAADNLQSGY